MIEGGKLPVLCAVLSFVFCSVPERKQRPAPPPPSEDKIDAAIRERMLAELPQVSETVVAAAMDRFKSDDTYKALMRMSERDALDALSTTSAESTYLAYVYTEAQAAGRSAAAKEVVQDKEPA